MAKVLGNISFPAEKYIKDGEEKTRWTRHGILLETDRGYRIKLISMPLGVEPGGAWFSVFPDDRQQPSAPKPAQAVSEPQGDQDEIPF